MLENMTNLEIALGLMESNPATFKQGYTLENAVLAVADLRNLSTQETDELRVAVTQAATA